MEIRVLTSSSVHSRGLDDFIASQMIHGKSNDGLQFRRTGRQVGPFVPIGERSALVRDMEKSSARDGSVKAVAAVVQRRSLCRTRTLAHPSGDISPERRAGSVTSASGPTTEIQRSLPSRRGWRPRSKADRPARLSRATGEVVHTASRHAAVRRSLRSLSRMKSSLSSSS